MIEQLLDSCVTETAIISLSKKNALRQHEIEDEVRYNSNKKIPAVSSYWAISMFYNKESVLKFLVIFLPNLAEQRNLVFHPRPQTHTQLNV